MKYFLVCVQNDKIKQDLKKYLIPGKGLESPKQLQDFSSVLLCNECSLKALGLKSVPKYYI